MVHKIKITIGIAMVTIMALSTTPGFAQPVHEGAAPGKPDILVDFNVENADVEIYAELPGPGGDNSTDAFAQFTLKGTGSAYGIFEAHSHPDTGWASVDGWFVGSQGDLTSTFQAQGIRNNTNGIEGLTSTFTVTQTLDAAGIGPLKFRDNGRLACGLYVYGEAGASSSLNTWALGTAQAFEGTPASITVTMQRQFEQHNIEGFLMTPPNNAQTTFFSNEGDRYTGVIESGTYNETDLGIPVQPGFGFALGSMDIDVHCDPSQFEAQMWTDRVVGETSTWFTSPGYLGAP